jgi:hypothetical protein
MLLWISLNTRKCYLGGRDQALEFLEGREPRLSNFLGIHCNITINLYFGTSFYHIIVLNAIWSCNALTMDPSSIYCGQQR